MKNFTLLFLFAFSTLFSQDISDNLLLQFDFDGNTIDSSMNGYHGVSYGGVSYVNDRFGNPNSAAYFDGINDYVDLPNISELKPFFPMSFSFWIKYDSEDSRDRDVFNTSFEEDRNTGVYFNSQISTGNYAINYGDGSYNYTSTSRQTYVSDQAITINEWHHVVVILNTSLDMQIYVDCNDSTGTYSGGGGDLQYSETSGNIGRHDRDLSLSANYFKGAIDDFRYWNRAIEVDEISDLCNNLTVNEFNISSPEIKIYPNPNSGIFNIESKNVELKSIFVYNSLGQEVGSFSFKKIVDLSYLPQGSYFVNLEGDSFVETRKIIIN